MRDITKRAWMTAGALAVLISAACGGQGTDASASKASAASMAPATPGGLTQFQLEHGIGPVTAPVTLDAKVDEAKAKAGAEVFAQKCASCHKMAERYVGPALGDVTKRRSPAFVMNMALNPFEMVEKHPETKKLLAEYYVPMPSQNLSQDDARSVLEFLRTQATDR